MKVVDAAADAESGEDAKAELRIMSKLQALGASDFALTGRGGGSTKDQQVVIFLDFMPGGSVLDRIRHSRAKKLDEVATRFYCAAMILGLEDMHSKKILHRDIKPENVLIDVRGYAKLADFGFAKVVRCAESEIRHSVVGTAEYFPPELAGLSEEEANKQGGCYNKSVDLWGLGVTLYNCLVGKRPFLPKGKNSLYSEADEDVIYDSIMSYADAAVADGSHNALWSGRGGSHADHISTEACSLVEQLLAPCPADRLGMGADGYRKLKEHRWFGGFDWAALRAGEMIAPWLPPCSERRAEAPPEEVSVTPAPASSHQDTRAPASTDELHHLAHQLDQLEVGHPSNAETKSAPASHQQRNQRIKVKKKAKSKEMETETTAELQDRGLAAFGEKDFQVSHRR